MTFSAIKLKSAAVFVVVLALSAAAMAASATKPDLNAPSLNGKVPADIIISENDITDRGYRVLGDITVSVDKVGVFDVPPIRTKVENALRIKAAGMGADAVVQVRYVEHGFGGVIHASMEALGRAVVFDSSVAAGPHIQSPATSQSSQSAQPQTAGTAPPPGTRQLPSQADMKAKVQSYFDAINAGNADAAIAYYASDATIEDPIGSQLQQGKAAVEAFVRGVVSRNTKFDVIGPVRGSNINVAAVALKAHGSGRTLNIIEVYTFNPAGQFSSMKAIWGNEDREN